MLCSCGGRKLPEPADREHLMTQQSDSLVDIVYEDGGKANRVFAPLLERYEYASEPYTEFRKGVEVITYDSLGGMDGYLEADYVLQLERQQLWEARGNVVVVNATHDTLWTQQLFWNRRRKLIYSNVDSRIRMADGSVQVGTSFESDEEFRNWVIRGSRGRFLFDAQRPADSTGAAGGAPTPEQRQPSDV